MIIISHPARIIPKQEYYDNRKEEFITVPEQKIPAIHLQLEHSLKSIGKWESTWYKSFIETKRLTPQEFIDYIRCMTMNPQKDPDIYKYLSSNDFDKIIEYMQKPQSAWQIRPKVEDPKPKKKSHKKKKKIQTTSSESLWYAMIQYGLPADECQNWHLNRLLAMLDYFDYMNDDDADGSEPKLSEHEILEHYRILNEKNRKRFNSKG